jgi:hypothetical protein
VPVLGAYWVPVGRALKLSRIEFHDLADVTDDRDLFAGGFSMFRE